MSKIIDFALSGGNSSVIGGEPASSNGGSSSNAWMESGWKCQRHYLHGTWILPPPHPRWLTCNSYICLEIDIVHNLHLSQVAVLTEERVGEQLGEELARARICLLHWFVCLSICLSVCLFVCFFVCFGVCFLVYNRWFCKQDIMH